MTTSTTSTTPIPPTSTTSTTTVSPVTTPLPPTSTTPLPPTSTTSTTLNPNTGNLFNIQPPEITNEQRLVNVNQRIRRTIANSYQELCNIQKQGIDMVWNNPFFGPQDIVDSLGVDAGRVFQYHSGLTSYITALATAEGIEPDINLPTNAFTINGNGTVTILASPYVPPV